jgi:hypothetical protein
MYGNHDQTLVYLSQMYRNVHAKVKTQQTGDLERAVVYLQMGRDLIEEHAKQEPDIDYRDNLNDLAEDVTTSIAVLEQWA